MLFSCCSSENVNFNFLGNEFPCVCLIGGLLSQSCVQNTRCVTKGKDNKLYIYATVDIKKGEKLTHSYVRNLLHTGTVERRKNLRQRQIVCFCPRCCDPTELGTNISAIMCQKCEGCYLPENPLDEEGQWDCRQGCY